jgi:arabinan endo-1,5-alpha-L-arabinosidase
MKTREIQIRDPYIYPDQESRTYYMFGTTDEDCWHGPGQGFDCYSSKDLLEWEGPIPAFRPAHDFWGKENFWAPEVHKFNGRFYMFASFIAPNRYRGTQILAAELPLLLVIRPCPAAASSHGSPNHDKRAALPQW